jgi:hypothetical protein
MASAGGQNRSLVFKVKPFLPTDSEGRGGDFDNDGSANEGGTERAWSDGWSKVVA